jgi:hypothetical protein
MEKGNEKQSPPAFLDSRRSVRHHTTPALEKLKQQAAMRLPREFRAEDKKDKKDKKEEGEEEGEEEEEAAEHGWSH